MKTTSYDKLAWLCCMIGSVMTFASVNPATRSSVRSALKADSIDARILSIDEQILSHRHQIKSGCIDVIYTRTAKGKDDPNMGGRVVSWFDGGSRREEFTQQGNTWVKCFNESQLSELSRDPKTGRPMSGVTLRDRRGLDPRSEELKVFEPLRFMLFPTWYRGLTFRPSDFFITSPARRHQTLTETTWNGKNAWLITCIDISDSDYHCRYWVVPELGYNIVRMTAVGIDGQSKGLRASLTCTLQEVSKGIWFPRTVYFEQAFGDDSLTETATITCSNINGVIPPKTFEPAGLALPAGTRIARVPAGPDGHMVKWDGKKIVPLSLAERMELRGFIPSTRGGWFLRITFITLSAILAAFGVMSLKRALRRRPAGGTR